MFFEKLKKFKHFQQRFVVFVAEEPISINDAIIYTEYSGVCHLHKFEAQDEARLAAKRGYLSIVVRIKPD